MQCPASFQRAMDKILKNESGKFIISYLEDIIVFYKTEEEHLKHLQIAFEKLKLANITLNKNKCKYYKNEIKILGFLKEGTVLTDPEKVQAIRDFQKPNTIKELRSFLGMTGFCREFIIQYAKKIEPIEKLLIGETKRSIKARKWN